MIEKRLIIVLLSIVYCSAQVWEEPYIIDPENVNIGIAISSDSTTINMNEEIPAPYLLCSLNYEGMIGYIYKNVSINPYLFSIR